MSKSKRIKHRGRTIRSRGTSWQVDFGTKNGKRVQICYKTKEDAKTAINARVQQQQIEMIDQNNKRVAVYDLTDKQRIDIITALDKLPKHSSLSQAVDFYLQHTQPTGGSFTVTQVLEEYLEAKTKANRREQTLKGIRGRIGRFARQFGDVPVHQISTHDVEQWMDGYGYRKVSRLNYRTAFVGFFNYALKQEYISQNPASKIERPILDEKIPEILSPTETQRLMFVTQENYPDMVPYFALSLFAGLRPNEANNLDWRNVNLKSKLITVRPEVAKKRRQRLVDISGNLLEWLVPYKRDSGTIHFSRISFDGARKKAQVIPWVNDILRHSYASYYLAKHQDAAKTALQMGHIRTDVLFNHYRELVTLEDAEIYWNIKPRKDVNIIRINV